MKKTDGSYYIRARPTGWYVWFQYYVNGARHQEKVAELALQELGFKPQMSVDEAKNRCAQLNKERAFVKDKIRGAAKRVTELKTIDETLFPTQSLKDFQALLEDENFGSEAHLQKLYSHFNFIQEMCNHLRILPIEYKDSSKKIYKYFIKKKISLNYASRILSVLNRWGKFQSRATGKFYDEVQLPRGNEQSAIADAQRTKKGTETELGVRTESLPLAPEKLESAKAKFSLEQYNWLKLSVWFGLRPEEVDCLKDEKTYKLEFHLKKQIHILHLYQSKLKSVAKDKRWKKIPVIYTAQQECLQIIAEGSFERPLNKTVRKHVGKGITLYGGRKNFVDMMLDKGQRLEDISLWLGHKDISTTWEHYKNRDNVNYVETETTKRITMK